MVCTIFKHFFISPSNPSKPRPLSVLLSSSLSTASPLSDQTPLVADVVTLLTHHRSKSRWSHLRNLLTSTTTNKLTPFTFSQIALHLKSNPHLALNFFNFTLRNSLCDHDLRSHSTIIHLLSRARLKARAQHVIRYALVQSVLFGHGDPPVKLFEVLVRTYRDCDSAPFVFDLLIKSCLDMKKIDGSIRIVRMLRSRGISPQVSTCNALISSVSQCKGSYAGYGVFREVFSLENDEGESEVKRAVRVRPNVNSFNSLMVGFYRDGDMEMVEEVWSEMGRFGCAANEYSYSILMAVFCDGERMQEAETIWKEMRVNGIRPDLVAYNTIIGGFCKIGEVGKAEDFVREMGLSGIGSTSVTLEHLMNGYCKVGDFDSAILVYKDMIRKKFRAEALTIDALIGGLCEKKRLPEALKILRFATRDACFYPSRMGYEFLIKGLCDEGKMNEALKLQAEMVGKGFEPNSGIYEAFIEGYRNLGNEEMVSMLGKEISELEKQQEE
ncbi:hypothetical protein K2173_002345 [Erythroxylum novogranatense]|uniref:Pentatricopeptide repeat-containing protein n=1 Tax=Erythroxylum novogranatense TaxID=1862640 RepID=A0AAV8T9G7_9ROSI|nr:hypothetical protein K2173_002345 [Erythroxylum novogranatense]